MPEAGIEPARPFYERQILNLLCLPISPLGQTQSNIVIKTLRKVMRCNNEEHVKSYHEQVEDPSPAPFLNNHEAMQTKGLPHISILPIILQFSSALYAVFNRY